MAEWGSTSPLPSPGALPIPPRVPSQRAQTAGKDPAEETAQMANANKVPHGSSSSRLSIDQSIYKFKLVLMRPKVILYLRTN